MPINDVRPDQEGEFVYVNTSGALARGDGGTIAQTGHGTTGIVSLGSATGIYNNTTFSGGIGTTGYTVNDVVAALKNLDLLGQ